MFGYNGSCFKGSFLFFMAKILLHEPEKRMKDMYTELIETAGFDIIVCDNSQECLKSVLKEKPSAIVTSAGKLESTWLIERVRGEKNPQISSIPILVVIDGSEKSSEYISLGATKTISKFPGSGERLVSILKQIIHIPRMGF